MKQLLQNMRNGQTNVVEVPVPSARAGAALVRTHASLVSAGTERMLVEFAEKSLVGKAQSRPDLVRQLLDKARREGLLSTVESAFNRLDQPMALGYSSAGTVVAIGDALQGFQVGDRVACAGGGFAVHAEYAVVPQNLLVKLPDQVDFESAAFTTLGAIAMHGFRLANPQFGERVAVIGLGLLGLLGAQIARAAGCLVLGIDTNPERVELAKTLGLSAVDRSSAESAGLAFTQNSGFDIVLICADTKSDDPVKLAAALARDRACVVAVGAVGMALDRKPFYDKELTFKVSRSYGPGRYDSAYEEKGKDYPIGFVRWTEGRNLGSFVDLLAQQKVNVQPLVTHRYPIDQAPRAYDLITGKLKEPFLGVLLTYPQMDEKPDQQRVQLLPQSHAVKLETLCLGVLGAGNYASAVFLPTISKVGKISKVAIASASGLNARHAAGKFGFQYATSSSQEILDDQNINVIAVLTRHQNHARQVLAALRSGKSVYCEKPLAILPEELDEIQTLITRGNSPLLMVGFNRRFAPMAVQLKEFLQARSEPLVASYQVNAGYLPLNHWTQDPQQGGGRIIGEGCHFVDFLSFLVGSPPTSVTSQCLPDIGRYNNDNVVLTFRFSDGSIGTVTYLANGDKAFPKEQINVFSGGRVAVLNDFRTLEMVKNGRRKVIQSRLRQDKGHKGSWEAFIHALVTGAPAPIPYDHILGVSRATFAAVESIKLNTSVSIT